VPGKTILLVDDNEDFLVAMKERLEGEGYIVFPAKEAGQARNIFRQRKIDLAILDPRLKENDESDRSGINLAYEFAGPIPKIILTDYPAIDPVREALKPMKNGLPAAMYFIYKAEEFDKLKDAIKKCLESPPRSAVSRDVFVVHGHDAVRHVVEGIIRKFGLNPIVLVDQPGGGKTIIEQIRDHSDVGFAVVLLTPDDIAYSKEKPEDVRPRPRQNVIFELGYFIGKIGRERVCMLVKEDAGGIEMLSDLRGVIHIPYDEAGGWILKLAGNIRDAGLPVNLSKIIPSSGLRSKI
jgi:predicted nucleotide-binding protein